MKVTLSPEKYLMVESGGMSLVDALPVLNGVKLDITDSVVVANDDTRIITRYFSPMLGDGSFTIQVTLGEQERLLWLQYWVDGVPESTPLNSFGIQFKQINNLRQYLRNGYFSWDGSYYVQPDALAGMDADASQFRTGYGMTQLLPMYGDEGILLGFDRHDRFQQTFDLTLDPPIRLTIQTLWDQKSRPKDKRCGSERLAVFGFTDNEQGLRVWAKLVAAASPIAPRIPEQPITGWCSWYNLYASITEENILEHLRAVENTVAREDLPMRVFQIDDGFNVEMGDWLRVKPQFPRGMKPLLDDICAAGFIPGLWIAPFMVGNRSELYKEHPDWVVTDRLTGGPLAHMRFYGEFRWHKRSEEYYILDTTHPEAFEYLRYVFRIWHKEWGCDYFKTDFMHFGSEYGPDRAIWHTAGMTRIEIWRRTAEMIREEIGESLWLGCGFPLWASVGLVDAVRIGRDVGVSWSGNLSAQSLLRDQACRNFGNQILWQIDPDCVLLREKFSDLSETEIQTLALFAGMSGGVMMTSDNIEELSGQRLALWRLILSFSGSTCDFPLLGQTDISYELSTALVEGEKPRPVPRADDPILLQVRHPARSGGVGAIFLANPSNQTLRRRYTLSNLNINEPVFLYRWDAKVSDKMAVNEITITLDAHDSALFFFSTSPFEESWSA